MGGWWASWLSARDSLRRLHVARCKAVGIPTSLAPEDSICSVGISV